jgi:tetrapyrrole methylase family protein/MazG family protein
VSRARPHITVVGLGPAGAESLQQGAIALLAGAGRAYLRTSRHPAAAALEGVPSFDHLYEAADTFEQVYRAIVDTLVEAATEQAPERVVYAVPGSPLVAERTVELLRADQRVDLTVIPALSFIDLAWERLGIDPLQAGVRLVDAEHFGSQAADQRGPFLVGQCWSQTLLSDIKLGAGADDEAERPDVVLLHHLGLPDEQVVSVPWWELDRTLPPDHLTSLYIREWNRPAELGQAMRQLDALVHTLREQCPWDREQTHQTLMPHLVEEAYEVLDALGELDGSPAALAHLEEELGDLLFQIVFHARLATESGQFSLAEVAQGVHDKLVHRHPHVFADVAVSSADDVVANWEEIKKKEKGRASVTDGIPAHLPALLLSTKLQRKGRSIGLRYQGDDSDSFVDLNLVLEGLISVADDVDPSGDRGDAPLSDSALFEGQVGELLFGVADLASQLGIDPEQALRSRALRFRQAVVAQEAHQATPET